MQDDRIAWVILIAIVSAFFSPKNTMLHYVDSVIIVLLLFAVLVLKPRQPMPDTRALGRRSSETQGASGPSGFFHKARNFVINNPIMAYVQGEDRTLRIMELLSSHIIPGAAYDDSARGYPPRCHPGTRVKILERLTTWFYNTKRLKSLLWLSGPAGVGKSAILQTFAESVEQPVASVFVSRPNKRNDPNRIFITIAYQFAVHLEAYRNYIVDRLSVNPFLLNKSIQVQFQVFITEPFVEKKIGAGGPPLAILLDGLDEVEGIEAQRDIIRLISTFLQEHPDAPLAWIISSRPELHISNTFNEAAVRERFEPESIAINSTEARKDVERFLQASFETIRRDFPHPPLRNWPEAAAVAKLANAASGLFIFAETTVRFIRDPRHANPIPRLQIVLSIIDRSKGISIEERPFALLDNLYTEILSNVPSGLLPTTKLLMRLVLFFRSTDIPFGTLFPSESRTLRGMAMILQLDHYTVYAALNKCFSMLGIPPWDQAHTETLRFLHASFADYLMDSQRSGDFYISVDGVENDVLLFYLNLWHKHFGENSGSDVKLVDEHEHDVEVQEVSAEEIDKFNTGILEEMVGTLLRQMVKRYKPQPAASYALQQKHIECLDSLQKVNMITLCGSKRLYHDVKWTTGVRPELFSFAVDIFRAWQEFPHELRESGFLRQVSFKDINFDPSDLEAHQILTSEWLRFGFSGKLWDNPPSAPREESREAFLSRSPELPVLICGMVPRGRIALFKGNEDATEYCIVPYLE